MGSRYIEVLQSVEWPREGNSAEIKTAVNRLAQEVKHRLAGGSPDSKEFICSSVRAMARIKGAIHLESRMSCLIDACYFLFANGFNADAVETSRYLEVIARQSSDDTWIRKVETTVGIVHSHSGNIAESLIRFSTALSLARKLDDRSGEIAVLVNLGTALNYAALYREAIPCLLRAAALAESNLNTSPYLPHALCNLAQSHLHLGEYAQGFTAISQSLHKSIEPTDSLGGLSRTAREFTMVQLALEVGEIGVAEHHARQCRSYAVRARSRRASFMANVAEGLCQIRTGDVRTGVATLEDCLTNSGADGTPERMEALIALAKAYDDTGRPERGLKCVRQLLKGTTETRKASIAALFSANAKTEASTIFASEVNDLAALREREAQLKLRVAERESATSQFEILARLAVAADLREESSGEHGFRVGKLAGLLASSIGWNVEQCELLEVATRLHDIGKLAVPERILLNSEELQAAERHLVFSHCAIGAELLTQSGVPLLRIAEVIARCHHEWWDGTGYPSKLTGRKIPIEARIVALADVFDALTHGRPFAAPWPYERAVEYIQHKKGSQFDPELTESFLKLVGRLEAEHKDLDRYLGQAGKDSALLQARNRIRALIAVERAKVKEPNK